MSAEIRVICLFVAMLSVIHAYTASAAIPPEELGNCRGRRYTLPELEYYDENELIATYCRCRFSARNASELVSVQEQIVEATSAAFGRNSSSAIDAVNDLKSARFEAEVSSANRASVLRILKRNFQSGSDPACPDSH